MGNVTYKPGDIVPADGIYNVVHHKHRLLHGATLTKGMLFPECQTCQLKVRFVLVRAIKGGVIPFRSGAILSESQGEFRVHKRRARAAKA